jgi:hypothetical protein
MSSGDKCQIREKVLGDNKELIIAVNTQNGRCYYFLFFLKYLRKYNQYKLSKYLQKRIPSLRNHQM